MNNKLKLSAIIGKKIIYIKGYPTRPKKKKVDVSYILFDDGETILEFQEQEYSNYHDCNPLARTIIVRVNKELWNTIKTKYPDANNDDGFIW